MGWRLVLDHVAMAQSLLKGNVADVKAIRAARRDFKAWKKDYEPIRRDIQKRACHGAGDDGRMLTMPYSVLLKYYLLGKKHFSEL